MKNCAASLARFRKRFRDSICLTKAGEEVIAVYQKFLSPDHGIFWPLFGYSRCRFFPSCSSYAIESIRQYGLSKGIVASCRRMLKCHPWYAGGYEPLPMPPRREKEKSL